MEMKPQRGRSRQSALVASSRRCCVCLTQLLLWWRGQGRRPAMGFGDDLWCPQAHEAVVRLLDSELHLMEVMKKWMGQRAKSERDFAAQLHHMTCLVEKMERSQPGAGPDYISQLNKVSGRLPQGSDARDTFTSLSTVTPIRSFRVALVLPVSVCSCSFLLYCFQSINQSMPICQAPFPTQNVTQAAFI